MERGVDFSTARLYILEGSKALPSAVRKHARDAAFVQRCQVHKKRKVVDHLPDEADARRLAVDHCRKASLLPASTGVRALGSAFQFLPVNDADQSGWCR